MCVSVYRYVHGDSWKSEQGIGCPGTGVMGNCESPDMGAGNFLVFCKSTRVLTAESFIKPLTQTLLNSIYCLHFLVVPDTPTGLQVCTLVGFLSTGAEQSWPLLHCLSQEVRGLQAKKQQ